MRVHVDWTRCDGHGACAELLPELLTTDEWGFPARDRGASVTPTYRSRSSEHARRAVKACPLPGAAPGEVTSGEAQPRRDSRTRKPLALASFSVG